MIFAYMGQGEAPDFDLQRKEEFESLDHIVIAREQIWPCNWFQQVENSLDAVHVSFVHHAGMVGPFGEAISQSIPKLEYSETESGIRQIATRSPTNVRISDWTFPIATTSSRQGAPGTSPGCTVASGTCRWTTRTR